MNRRFVILLSFLFYYSILFSQKDSIKVLFIGNSYTIGNLKDQAELPLRIKEMASTQGKMLTYETSLKGGKNLRWHWENKDAIEKIRRGGWDYVVIQDHSLGTIDSAKLFKKYASLFVKEIRKSGAEPLFYMTWGRQHRPSMIDTVAETYTKIAVKNKAKLVPAGLAWKKTIQEFPAINLYQIDKSHPRPEGIYLNACVFYAVLFNESPVKLDYSFTFDDIEINEETAVILRKIAWDVVSENSSIIK